ncbi:HAD hydrolase-like protein [uncultured Treponema sp.]|uniref:HAD hydrolase-like protein n=1 Tax=uncultured Treponema sp. TaxID=162155 RepID=UPI0015C1C434|nr:HAD hydrolase-like protein [uncultured Treponema sp.]
MATEIYVFDCDGVVINSAEDIASAVNVSLKQFGYWQIPLQNVVEFVGDGTEMLLLRALKFSTKGKFDENSPYGRESFRKILDFYLDYYHSHAVEKTTLYAGIKELFNLLKSKGKKICLLTNKPGQIALSILKKLEAAEYFDLITAPDTLDENGKLIPKKPAPDGLEYTLRQINLKYGANFKPENVIMFGDSAQDIQAGKAFGCKTVACRGGLGNKEKLLAEKADFSFSVAGEAEKFIDILSKDGCVSEMEKYAIKNEVPVLQDAGSGFIAGYIKNHSIKNILEIGTAIGTSAIRFAKIRNDIHVTTIEIDPVRHEQAVKNIEAEGLSDRITAVLGDALCVEVSGSFDLIFIDAAKAQYINFFNRFSPFLAEDGVIISDNLSFHGMVEDLSLTRNYSTIKLVKKIRKYIDFLKQNSEFETEFFKVGDGIGVTRRISSAF